MSIQSKKVSKSIEEDFDFCIIFALYLQIIVILFSIREAIYLIAILTAHDLCEYHCYAYIRYTYVCLAL